ncbi:MAG TPA: hypothetical protein VF618_10320 [Thermoanaerobaculia bacterium]
MKTLSLAAVVAAVSLALATAADAACTFQPRYEDGFLRWSPLLGAEQYQVLETGEGLVPRFYIVNRQTFLEVQHRATTDRKITYYVTAVLTGGIASRPVGANSIGASGLDACTEKVEVIIPADESFRRMTRKAVIAVAGSTAGANDGRFKTSLRLIANIVPQKGKVVFHPAGRAASATDPSLPYVFNQIGETAEWDDVVAAMGASGIGSLDIVPDTDGAEPVVPEVVARLFNDTASGTFGSNVEAVMAFDYRQAPGMTVEVPKDPRFRVNVGFRTLEAAGVRLLVYGADRRLRDFKDLEFPADYMQMTTIPQLIGSELEPGGYVQVLIGGAAVPFYTVTENRTNDPTVVLANPKASSRNVESYLE